MDNKYLGSNGLLIIKEYLNKQIGNKPSNITLIDYINQLQQPSLKVGETIIAPSSGVLTIPYATNDAPGIVIGSQEDDSISLKEDGTMTVNSLNVNKLYQNEEDVLILEYSGD